MADSFRDPRDFLRAKRAGRRWAVLSVYEALTSASAEACGIEALLVGDSLGMVLLGYPSTREVTMEAMLHHAGAVRRGAPRTFLIGDLPYLGICKGPAHALNSAKRFIRDAGCDAVKLEWGPRAEESAARIVRAGIPLMGHVGLTPQRVSAKAGYHVRGATAKDASDVLRAAQVFERAGAYSVLLECVPEAVGRVITQKLKVPTVGIGAGRYCDAQVLVYQDLVGLFTRFKPRYVRRYAHLGESARRALSAWHRDVVRGKFPGPRHAYAMRGPELRDFQSRDAG